MHCRCALAVEYCSARPKCGGLHGCGSAHTFGIANMPMPSRSTIVVTCPTLRPATRLHAGSATRTTNSYSCRWEVEGRVRSKLQVGERGVSGPRAERAHYARCTLGVNIPRMWSNKHAHALSRHFPKPQTLATLLRLHLFCSGEVALFFCSICLLQLHALFPTCTCSLRRSGSGNSFRSAPTSVAPSR